MSKLDSVLGSKFQEHKQSILTRSFMLGEHTFKVRIPTVGETEAMYDRLKTIDDDKVAEVYQELTQDLIKFKDSGDDTMVFTDDDVVVEGRSMKDAAKTTVTARARILEYFKMLVPEEGQSWEGVEYKDIEAGMPWAVQIEMVEKIIECISPNYKDIKSK